MVWLELHVTVLGDDAVNLTVVNDVTGRRRTDEALRGSEAKYRTLFESIDQGFYVVEVLLDGSGTAVDYVFLEANSAFEGQTGLVDVVGKRMRELAPNHEEF